MTEQLSTIVGYLYTDKSAKYLYDLLDSYYMDIIYYIFGIRIEDINREFIILQCIENKKLIRDIVEKMSINVETPNNIPKNKQFLVIKDTKYKVTEVDTIKCLTSIVMKLYREYKTLNYEKIGNYSHIKIYLHSTNEYIYSSVGACDIVMKTFIDFLKDTNVTAHKYYVYHQEL